MPQVLVVDDDASIRDVVRLALEDEGYVVRVAADGLAALAVLRASREPMVVLLDQMMPWLAGEEVLAAATADADLAARHVFIMMTANAHMLSTACRMLLDRIGAPVLAKPFDVDALLALVAEAVARAPGPVARRAIAC